MSKSKAKSEKPRRGRPPSDKPPDKRYNIRIPLADWPRWEALAKSKGLDVSGLVRMKINEACDRFEASGS